MIKLDDRQLWGNEAADDEDLATLNSYFVAQSEWDEFFDFSLPLSIARARKGMGKSALLRECAFRLNRAEDIIAIEIKSTDLVAQKPFLSLTPVEQIADWQQRICAMINLHVSKTIGLARTDDQITLIETAELAGFKQRNIVGALVDRLKGKLGPVELQKIAAPDAKALLGRVSSSAHLRVVLLIDDIDATFSNTDEECQRLSTFFSACRDIAANFKGIAIRTVIRSEVWASIRKKDEALDKVDQYIFDIRWSKKQFREFLAGRIESYCKRRSITTDIANITREQLIGLVFESSFPWGKGRAAPHRVIHTYAGGRPRWAAQLCRMAGKETLDTGTSSLITFGAITQVLKSYGQYRLDDISREHRHQCDTVADIVNAFAKQPSTFTTPHLLHFIEAKILPHLVIRIDGRSVTEAIEVAHFLYRIGFLLGVEQENGGNPDYYDYEVRPELLQNRANLDSGMKWRVHPCYQSALSST